MTGYTFQHSTKFETAVLMNSKTTRNAIRSVEIVSKKLYIRQRPHNTLFNIYMNKEFLIQVIRNTIMNSFGIAEASNEN